MKEHLRFYRFTYSETFSEPNLSEKSHKYNDFSMKKSDFFHVFFKYFDNFDSKKSFPHYSDDTRR